MSTEKTYIDGYKDGYNNRESVYSPLVEAAKEVVLKATKEQKAIPFFKLIKALQGLDVPELNSEHYGHIINQKIIT